MLDEALSSGGTRAWWSRTPRRTYAAGRRGKGWRKVKPVRTYDLVVLGAEWGHGRRRGWLSNLHLGASTRHRGVRDGRKMLQGPDRRAPRGGRPGSSSSARPAAAASPCSFAAELVVEIALDGVQLHALPGSAWRCASPASSATDWTRAQVRRTRSTTCARYFPERVRTRYRRRAANARSRPGRPGRRLRAGEGCRLSARARAAMGGRHETRESRPVSRTPARY